MGINLNILLLLFSITHVGLSHDLLVQTEPENSYSETYYSPDNSNLISGVNNGITSPSYFELISEDLGFAKNSESAAYATAPCQTIISQLDSATPAPNGSGYILVRTNDPITLNGSATFSGNGTGARYEWDLGDGNTVAGQTATFSYDTPGLYFVNLYVRDSNTSIDPLGCTNTNMIYQVILVGPLDSGPDFTGTAAAKEVICLGNSTTITGIVNPVQFNNGCDSVFSDVTFLPDGKSNDVGEYKTSITIDCYDPAQTLDNINQLLKVRINMEHSYLSDLAIILMSPDGKRINLRKHVDPVSGGVGASGGTANLGIPWATNPKDGESYNTTPGFGYDYNFIPGNANPTLVQGVAAVEIDFPKGDGPGTYKDAYVPAGNYSSEDSFSELLGTPLNGDWTLIIEDHKKDDNGYIFEWSIDFASNLRPPYVAHTPTIITEAWDVDPTIINTIGNSVTVQPAAPGVSCYTYRATDEFGSEYTEQVCIEVLDNIPPVLVANVTSEAFYSGNVIKALATGDGVYEYSLNNGSYQLIGTFNDVPLGENIITARDIYGCDQEASVIVTVIDYPRYFTPNGDNVHDTWNIAGLANQPNAKVTIFNRYGKILIQMSPADSGWDGTHNGRNMPTNDYWFIVEYNEPITNNRKEFRAHFTLKR